MGRTIYFKEEDISCIKNHYDSKRPIVNDDLIQCLSMRLKTVDLFLEEYVNRDVKLKMRATCKNDSSGRMIRCGYRIIKNGRSASHVLEYGGDFEFTIPLEQMELTINIGDRIELFVFPTDNLYPEMTVEFFDVELVGLRFVSNLHR